MLNPNLSRHENLLKDLKYDPETNPQPVDAHRAFTMCELAIYRFRDTIYDINDTEYKLLSDIADEILSLRNSWQGHEK